MSLNEDTKMLLIWVGGLSVIICTIAICLCYYNVATTKAAIAAGLEQSMVGNSIVWTKPKQ